MAQRLYDYFELELDFIRRMASDFARRYPDDAKRLELEDGRSRDPHVERLIEAFALIAGRIQMRLDDGFPELTDALLGILHPQYLAPIPSLTMVEFQLDPQKGRVKSGVTIGRGRELLARSAGDVRCRFRTSMEVRLWPIAVRTVDVPAIGPAELRVCRETRTAVRVGLATLGGEPMSEYEIPRLCFHHDADPASYELYEALHRDCVGIVVKQGNDILHALTPDHLQPVGFAREHALLDDRHRTSNGYRLLQEYFALPQKFLFSAVGGLGRVRLQPQRADFELWFLLGSARSVLADRLKPTHFRLGCTPAVNRFRYNASPIRVDRRKVEYPVVPEARAPYGYEVLSLEEVVSTVPGSTEPLEFRPFYELRHGDPKGAEVAFWHSTRRESLRPGDDGTDVFITLVDDRFRPTDLSRFEVLHVTTECSNRDLASRLVFGDPGGDFQLEGVSEVARVRSLLTKATPPKRIRPNASSRWRLVSQLSLNHLSLVGDAVDAHDTARPRKTLEALREILELYDYGAGAVGDQRIRGLAGVDARRVTRVLPSCGPVRGVEVDLWFDEAMYTGSGVYLFAAVLERFLALHTTINSFTTTRALLRGRERREELLAQWPPRTGRAAEL